MATITGTPGNDTLLGTAGNDTINGLAGNDSLDGGTGNDSLSGGDGNDTLFGGLGADTMFGGYGNDTFYIDNIGDVITEYTTGGGIDTVYSTLSLDASTIIENIYLQGSLNVYATGNSFDNILGSNAGDNSLNGGAGNDTYIFTNAWGNDTVIDSSGIDTLDLSALTSSVSVNLASLSSNEVSSAGGTINWDTATSIEKAITGSGNDVLYGTKGNDSLTGGVGNDQLNGLAGNDTMVGGTGNDTYGFAKGRGQDVIVDSSGTDAALFGSTVSQNQVAIFKTTSGDLQIGFADSTSDLLTVHDFGTAGHQVEKFLLSTGNYLSNADVNSVIQTMSSYAVSNGVSFTSLSDVESNSNLMGIINAAWHA